jgi:hypothetical protein
MTDPQTLTDDALVERIASSAAKSREATAALIADLVELERRHLHLAHGFRSLFGYCRRVLHCSEAGAYDRMEAAHAAARFPVIIAMLADGALHLTAVRLLAPHLKDEDHLALLGAAIHQSSRDVRVLLAGWFPQADVPSSVRRLPTPLSSGRYEFRFTGDEETAALLQEARELLSHALPDGNMAAIFKRGLRLVVAEARKKRHSATDRARRSRRAQQPPTTPRSRDIPAEVARAVWERDGGQCAFVGKTGVRCEERRFLEFHHRKPWEAGGGPSVENIALRCEAHNQYESRAYFGPLREAAAQMSP